MLWSLAFQVLCYSSTLITFLVIFMLLKSAIQCHHIYGIFKRNGIPGPKPTMFFGNYWDLNKFDDPNELLEQWLKQYGDVFGYFVGSKPHLVINDVDVIKEVMIRQNRLFRNRPQFALKAKPISQSVLVAEDEDWQNHRKVITPAFSPAKVKLMSPIVNSRVDVLLEEISKMAEQKQDFNIYERVQALTLDVIASCALAMEVDCQRDLDNSFFKAVKEYFLICQNTAVKAAILFPLLIDIFTFINNYLSAGKMTDTIVENLKRVIKTRRQSTQKRTDLLQLMLDSADESRRLTGRPHMSDEGVMANAYLFMLAGYETTSTALGFTFYLLAKHQDIQQRLYEEVVQHLGDVQHPSYEQIMKMQYLDQVMNESMRIYPPVTLFLTRTCSEDCEINGLKIPEAVVVLAPVWRIHHDPRFYPDPWMFDPERFSPENKENLHQACFLPFGIGPRNCIGMKFALLEAKIAVARVLKSFHLSFSDRTEDPPHLTCPTVISYPKNGVFIKAAQR